LLRKVGIRESLGGPSKSNARVGHPEHGRILGGESSRRVKLLLLDRRSLEEGAEDGKKRGLN